LFNKHGFKGIGTPLADLAEKMHEDSQKDETPAEKTARQLKELFEDEDEDEDDVTTWEDDIW